MRDTLCLGAMSFAGCLVLSGCYGGQTLSSHAITVDGNPKKGAELIRGFGCGRCHVIPGIHNANGLVGPPLLYFSRRTMIAGQLPNTQDNLVRWVEHPRRIEPGTAMPDLGLTDDQAYDVSAYLYTLR